MEKEVFIVSIIDCGLRRFTGVKNHLRHQPELSPSKKPLPKLGEWLGMEDFKVRAYGAWKAYHNTCEEHVGTKRGILC